MFFCVVFVVCSEDTNKTLTRSFCFEILSSYLSIVRRLCDYCWSQILTATSSVGHSHSPLMSFIRPRTYSESNTLVSAPHRLPSPQDGFVSISCSFLLARTAVFSPTTMIRSPSFVFPTSFCSSSSSRLHVLLPVPQQEKTEHAATHIWGQNNKFRGVMENGFWLCGQATKNSEGAKQARQRHLGVYGTYSIPNDIVSIDSSYSSWQWQLLCLLQRLHLLMPDAAASHHSHQVQILDTKVVVPEASQPAHSRYARKTQINFHN